MRNYLKQLRSGLFVPAKAEVGVRCGYCPMVIFKDEESRGRLFLYDNRPICATCRIKRGSRAAARIYADQDKHAKDVQAREAFIQGKADDVAREVAAQTQADTQTGITQ